MLADPKTIVRLRLYAHYTATAVDLIREAEGHPDALPHNWVKRMEAYQKFLEERHVNCPPDIDAAITASKVKLTHEQRQHVINDVVRAIEACWPRFNHMDESMPRWKSREAWHPENKPPQTQAAIQEALGPYFIMGDVDSATLLTEATAYADEWAKPVGAVGADGKPGHVNPVEYWRNEELLPRFPRLQRVALHFLSLPLSTACVERAFSKLTRMESNLRFRMLDETVRREHFLKCHKSAVLTKLEAATDAYEAFMGSLEGGAAAAAK
jgi:hypothetical protein